MSTLRLGIHKLKLAKTIVRNARFNNTSKFIIFWTIVEITSSTKKNLTRKTSIDRKLTSKSKCSCKWKMPYNFANVNHQIFKKHPLHFIIVMGLWGLTWCQKMQWLHIQIDTIFFPWMPTMIKFCHLFIELQLPLHKQLKMCTFCVSLHMQYAICFVVFNKIFPKNKCLCQHITNCLLKHTHDGLQHFVGPPNL